MIIHIFKKFQDTFQDEKSEIFYFSYLKKSEGKKEAKLQNFDEHKMFIMNGE